MYQIQTDHHHLLKRDNTYLIHAMECEDFICSSEGCFEMKQLILHSHVCNVPECLICKSTLILCCYHSWICTFEDKCTLPFCSNLRQKIIFQMKVEEAVAEMKRNNRRPLEFSVSLEPKNSIQESTEAVHRHRNMLKHIAKQSE